jgi:hypothetical protein
VADSEPITWAGSETENQMLWGSLKQTGAYAICANLCVRVENLENCE